MNNAHQIKDVRGVLLSGGAEAVRDSLENLEPFNGSEADPAGAPKAFPITRANQLSGIVDVFDFVEGLLTAGGASLLYGPSNCGKSFWMLDLAVAVATGRPFRNELEVEQGAVVYVALEGDRGILNPTSALG
jgi:hypothetical protein